MGFIAVWWCYIEGLKEGGAQHKACYHLELWSMEWVGCINSHELLEDDAYITYNMECWLCPSWWKGEEQNAEESNELGALGTNYTQGFDLNVDLYSIDVNDVSLPIIKLSDAKRNASLLSNFLLDN